MVENPADGRAVYADILASFLGFKPLVPLNFLPFRFALLIQKGAIKKGLRWPIGSGVFHSIDFHSPGEPVLCPAIAGLSILSMG